MLGKGISDMNAAAQVSFAREGGVLRHSLSSPMLLMQRGTREEGEGPSVFATSSSTPILQATSLESDGAASPDDGKLAKTLDFEGNSSEISLALLDYISTASGTGGRSASIPDPKAALYEKYRSSSAAYRVLSKCLSKHAFNVQEGSCPVPIPAPAKLLEQAASIFVKFFALHCESYLQSACRSADPSSFPQPLLDLLGSIDASFSLFPPDGLYGTLKGSPADIDQKVFQGVSMDGSCGDLLSLLTLLCSTASKSGHDDDAAAALTAFSAVLSVSVQSFGNLTQAPLRLPPAPTAKVASFCIESIISATGKIKSSASSKSASSVSSTLELASRTLSLLLRHSSELQLAVTTTNNGVHRNLCRSLLTLLTPDKPLSQIVSALSVLPRLIVEDELEEKVFNFANVSAWVVVVASRATEQTSKESKEMRH